MEIRAARLVWSLAGVGTALWLVYAELFKIDAICLWCSAVHVITLASSSPRCSGPYPPRGLPPRVPRHKPQLGPNANLDSGASPYGRRWFTGHDRGGSKSERRP